MYTKKSHHSASILNFSGSVKVFHGVNFVRKEPPWYHEKLLDPKYAKDKGEYFAIVGSA